MSFFTSADADAAGAVPAHFVTAANQEEVLAALPDSGRAWVTANRFKPDGDDLLRVPDADGTLAAVLVPRGSAPSPDPFAAGHLAGIKGVALRLGLGWDNATLAATAFGLGSYRFGRYRSKGGNEAPRLAPPAGVDRAEIERIVAGVFLCRDLVNTPANDLGPAELADAAATLAAEHGAAIEIVDGERLSREFPMVATVGAASSRAPRVVDLTWGATDAPKVTLVGKGVCFDTGGLDLKSASGMALMKKDMGGAANALGLAAIIMASGLPVRLRCLIGAVENAVGGDAFRPGDVLKSRKGLTVEIGNTDAEGRLVLADLLALAEEEAPDLLIDFATLTGAARVALGPDLPALYTGDDVLAASLAAAGEAVADPMWRLPLWDRYRPWLDSKIADVNHISSQPFAGSITAALFLSRFVERPERWAHFDLFAWNPQSRPGRPEGGEAQAIRAIFHALMARYGGAGR